MPYGISGTVNEDCELFIFNKNSGKILKKKSLSTGNYSEYLAGGEQEVLIVGVPNSASSRADAFNNVITKDGIIFDSDLWFNLGTGATSRQYHSAVEYNGKMYVFGGYNGSYFNTLWEYDITNDTWTQKTSGATVRNAHSAVEYNGKMYIFGGLDV
jgi:hypothetical protein